VTKHIYKFQNIYNYIQDKSGCRCLPGKDLYGIFKHLWNPMELLPKPGVAGSIPAGGTISLVFQELFASLFVTDCD